MTDSERAAKRQARRKALSKMRHFWMKWVEIYENIRWAVEKESWPRRIMRWVKNIVWLWDNLFAKGPTDVFASYAEELDVELSQNKAFVDLFWGSTVSQGFEISTFPIGDNLRVTKALHPEFGTLYFCANNHSSVVRTNEEGLTEAAATPLPTFYHSPGFDFSAVVEGFWRACNGRILVKHNPRVQPHLGVSYSWDPMPENTDPIYGSTRTRLDAFKTRYVQRVAGKKSTMYLLIGPTGTSKTTFLWTLAAETGHRFLFLPASLLFSLDVSQAKQLLEAFRMTALVIEDIDHGEIERDKDDTLLLLARFRVLLPGTAMFLTANNAAALDPAFVSRVNQIEIFDNPEPGEAREIFERYLERFGVRRPVDVSRLIDLMAGMPGRDIRQVAEDCFDLDSDDDIAALIQQRRRVMGISLAAYESRRVGKLKSAPASAEGKIKTFSSQYVSGELTKASSNGRSPT
jgi:hypothetical protein